MTDSKLLLSAEAAAGISAGVWSTDDENALQRLREACEGFPGVWNLCARAGIALQNALEEAGDPDASNHDFPAMVDDFGTFLVMRGKCLNDSQLADATKSLLESWKN